MRYNGGHYWRKEGSFPNYGQDKKRMQIADAQIYESRGDTKFFAITFRGYILSPLSMPGQ